MIKEKEILLKQKIKTLIDLYGHNNRMKQEISEEFKSRGMSGLKASFVFSGNEDLNTLSDSEEDIRFLFLFSLALSKVLKDEEQTLKLEDYFSDIEINRWINYKENNKIKNVYPIIIKDVQYLGKNIWQTTLTSKQLNELDASNLLIYNFKTQRNPKITVAGEKINIDVNKVKDIKERMLNGEQFPDSITLNVLKGDIDLEHNPKNKTLIINEGLIINIIDGYHRKTANALALEENPDLDFIWSIRITWLSEKDAHDYMSQINKQKPINTEYIKQMDYSLPENKVVDVIVDDRLSELSKVMKDSDQYIKLNRALTKKSIIATAIKENYTELLKSSTNLRSIGRWIIEFTDYLMEYYTEEFIANPYEIKKSSMINHKNIFYAYIALSAKLYNNSNWKDILKQKMESINWNIDNQLWKDFGMKNNNDANKALRYKLYNLFAL